MAEHQHQFVPWFNHVPNDGSSGCSCGVRFGTLGSLQSADRVEWEAHRDRALDAPTDVRTDGFHDCRAAGCDYYADAELTGDTANAQHNDPVNHPSHYTNHPSGLVGDWYIEIRGTEADRLDGTSFYPTDSSEARAQDAGEEHPVDLRVRLWPAERGVRTQPRGREDQELRVPSDRPYELQRGGEDGDERIRLRSSTGASTRPSDGARPRAHSGDGKEAGAVSAAGRGSPPQERSEVGQPGIEFGAVDWESAGGIASSRQGSVGQGDSQAVRARDVEHDPVDHPSHYVSSPSGVECIDITRHMGFNLGNVVKYVWRNGLKGATPAIEDLKKARWYLDDEIAKLEGQS